MSEIRNKDWGHSHNIPVIPVTVVVIHGGLNEIKSLRKLIKTKYHVDVISMEGKYESPHFDISEKLFLFKN